MVNLSGQHEANENYIFELSIPWSKELPFLRFGPPAEPTQQALLEIYYSLHGPQWADYDAEQQKWERFQSELRDMIVALNEAGIETRVGLSGDDYAAGFPTFLEGHLIVASSLAASITALASGFKAYINRRHGREVIIKDKSHKTIIEIRGNFTSEEIDALLRERLLPRLQEEPTEGEREDGVPDE